MILQLRVCLQHLLQTCCKCCAELRNCKNSANKTATSLQPGIVDCLLVFAVAHLLSKPSNQCCNQTCHRKIMPHKTCKITFTTSCFQRPLWGSENLMISGNPGLCILGTFWGFLFGCFQTVVSTPSYFSGKTPQHVPEILGPSACPTQSPYVKDQEFKDNKAPQKRRQEAEESVPQRERIYT